MAAVNNSGEGHGSKGAPQSTFEELIYPEQVEANENAVETTLPPKYIPSPKHDKGGWGSKNPIKTKEEGQHLLDTGYKDGKQIYNITDEGKLVKFQPDGSPENGFHSYEVFGPPDIQPSVLKKMFEDGKISKSTYKKFMKGKKI